jgi:lipoyl(octanoyl) transferase
MNSRKRVLVSRMGRVPYLQALHLQSQLHQKRVVGEIPDVLVLLEHPHVITIGKSGKEQNILFPESLLIEKGIELVHINRGGDVTYHGPGQVVGYPIFNILGYGKGVRDFVTLVEEVFINLLGTHFGIKARRDSIYTGVWVEDEKVTAMGFEIRKYVSMHGFAFNVNTDLTKFRLINPCGIIGKGVASLAKLLGKDCDIDEIVRLVIQSFELIFDITTEEIEPNKVLEMSGIKI